MEAIEIFGIIIVILAVAFWILMIVSYIFPRVGHAIFGWHHCDPSGFDGASMTGTCKYCGKECLQDSQGNWF